MSSFPPEVAQAAAPATDLLAAAKADLAEHPVYGAVRSVDALRSFMEHHVVCVLDFMSIVKSLQRDLTSIDDVWLPPRDAEAARFINEIVLDEESDAAFSDLRPGAGPKSHFEWYLAAMDEMGADTAPMRALVHELGHGMAPIEALEQSALPSASIAFGRSTFELLRGDLHVRAAVFFHGREDVIPAMFLPLVRELKDAGTSCELLLGYLERHIEADGEHHGPLARRMLASIYGGNAAREAEGTVAAQAALAARRTLWDAVERAI